MRIDFGPHAHSQRAPRSPSEEPRTTFRRSAGRGYRSPDYRPSQDGQMVRLRRLAGSPRPVRPNLRHAFRAAGSHNTPLSKSCSSGAAVCAEQSAGDHHNVTPASCSSILASWLVMKAGMLKRAFLFAAINVVVGSLLAAPYFWSDDRDRFGLSMSSRASAVTVFEPVSGVPTRALPLRRRQLRSGNLECRRRRASATANRREDSSTAWSRA